MSMSILVVDDSPTELRLITGFLQKQGFDIVTATDGEQAVAKAVATRPSLIVLDVVMPGKNGFQVCRELKNTPETKDIKVLLLTSKNQQTDRFWGLKQGADEYMTKPFDQAALLAAVKKLT